MFKGFPETMERRDEDKCHVGASQRVLADISELLIGLESSAEYIYSLFIYFINDRIMK